MTENGNETNKNVSEIETLKTLRTLSQIKTQKKEKRKGVCLACGHTWEGRNTNQKKPPLCSKCGSRDCIWEESEIPVESSPEKPVDVSEAIQKVVGNSVQVITNPIQDLGKSDSEPKYAVWQNPEGSLEYGAIVNPETLASVEEIVAKELTNTSKESELSDIEILKAAGFIESGKTENQPEEEASDEEFEDEDEDDDFNEDDNEEIEEEPVSKEIKKKSVGFKIPLLPLIIVFAVIGGMFFFITYSSFKRKREEEDKAVEKVVKSSKPELWRERTQYGLQ